MESGTLTFTIPPAGGEETPKPGDILLVTEGDGEKLTAVRLDTPLPEGRQKGGYRTGALAAEMVRQIFDHLDRTERSDRNKRRAEGMAAAKAKGARFGRRPKERPERLEAERELWKRGEISAREAARRLGISHVTFLSWAGEE